MRKLYLALILCALFFSSYGQDPVSKITKNYFRSDPFNTEFSAFLTHLINDPALTQKVIEKRTDTSLFFFEGTYKAFNPFFFKPKRVEVVLNEAIVDDDSLPRDTIYSYELFAYDDNTREGIQEVKKEFEKIIRHYKASFNHNNFTESSPDEKLQGGIYNFFYTGYAVSPFSVSWYGPTERKEVCLVLTVRFDTYLNQAVLPMPFYTLQ